MGLPCAYGWGACKIRLSIRRRDSRRSFSLEARTRLRIGPSSAQSCISAGIPFWPQHVARDSGELALLISHDFPIDRVAMNIFVDRGVWRQERKNKCGFEPSVECRFCMPGKSSGGLEMNYRKRWRDHRLRRKRKV